MVVTLLLITISSHTFRSSMLVTGWLTIYLNVLRTSAILWPMFRFKRKLVHISLIGLISLFVVVEIVIAVLYTYPNTMYIYKTMLGEEATPPFPADHPFVQFTNLELLIFGVPIVLLVIVCCLISAVKLLLPNKNLHETEDYNGRVSAAITVMILGVQYVVWNAAGLTLWSLCLYYIRRSSEDHVTGSEDQVSSKEDQVMTMLFWGNMCFILNSALNPLVYIWRVKKLREYIVSLVKCYCLRKDTSDQRLSRIPTSRSIRETVH